MKIFYKISAMFLVFVLLLNFSGCADNTQASDLMEGIAELEVEEKSVDNEFRQAYYDFSLKLFKSVNSSNNENTVISPLSLQAVLAMAANGADNQTLSEMESLLGGIPAERLNEYLFGIFEDLDEDTLKAANSLWIKNCDGFTANGKFLQTNSSYYDAAIYKSDFDKKTVDDINAWIKDKTDGEIKSIISEIKEDTVMYLINAVLFDAKWNTPYSEKSIKKGIFTDASGKQCEAEMMSSKETYLLKDSKALGTMKFYKGDYAFVAMLPNEGVDINDYINSLSNSSLSALFKNRDNSAEVNATIPKFSCELDLELNESLVALGMKTAFDERNADFSRLGTVKKGNLYLSQVKQKAIITVDSLGTKAGAVSLAAVGNKMAIMPEVNLNFDRPFVYMIIDTDNNLPIFMGAVKTL